MRFYNSVFKFLIVVIFCNCNSSFASLFRDAETEEVIEEIIKPLKDASGIQDLEIYLLNDAEPNAFTTGGRKIFIHSSLIADFPDPDVLRGVIAHEMGHIIGQHLSRRGEVVQNSKYIILSSIALGVGAAIAGRGDGAIAAIIGGKHIADRSIFSFSRELESSADQKAFQLLEASGHSTIGMLNFFESVQPKADTNYVNQYELTHPLSSDRINVLRNVIKRSKFPRSQNTQQLVAKYKRVSTKLAAFTKSLEDVDNLDYSNVDKELELYKQAIKYFRKGEKSNALNYINKLILKHTDDPFYHELKGQIFLQHGVYVSVAEYTIALSLKPDNDLIKLGHAISTIIQMIDIEDLASKAADRLEGILQRDKNNFLAMFYLSRYYEHYNMKGKAYLISAQLALKTGRIKDARILARSAQEILEKNSPHWYKAGDILSITNP